MHDRQTSSASEQRLRALLAANEAVVRQLEPDIVLKRIVDAAVQLVGARYGALGVLSPYGGLERFIHAGMPDDTVSRIGHLPEGHGLLGALIREPSPIRLESLSADPRSSGFPEGHPPMEGFLGVPIRVRGTVYGNLYLTEPRSGSFSAEDEELVSALAATAGFAIDNSRLFAETQRRQAWAEGSAEVTAALLGEEDVDPLAVLANRVLSLADAEMLQVLVPGDDPAFLTVAVARGRKADSSTGRRVTVAGSLAGRVLEGGRPLIINDGSEVDAGPTMAMPLPASGKIIGVFIVARARGSERFTRADLDMVEDFAGQASLAIELSAAKADRQRIVMLEDRSRIARELHDNVIQQLFATGLGLQAVATTVPEGHSRQRLEEAIDGLDAAVAQIRTAIFALTKTERAPVGVRHRLIDVANELSVGLARTPRLTFVGPVDLVVVGALANDVVAVVRESLANVAKHAAAGDSAVVVTVAPDGDLTVEVGDDGVGVPDPPSRSGLTNLERRALDRGGHFDYVATPEGTTVRWTVPVARAAQPGAAT